MKRVSTISEIPRNGILMATVANDVMDVIDFPMYALYMRDGLVVHQQAVCLGCHTFDDMVGKNVMELIEWFKYDNTGTHPQVDHCLEVLVEMDSVGDVSHNFPGYVSPEDYEQPPFFVIMVEQLTARQRGTLLNDLDTYDVVVHPQRVQNMYNILVVSEAKTGGYDDYRLAEMYCQMNLSQVYGWRCCLCSRVLGETCGHLSFGKPIPF